MFIDFISEIFYLSIFIVFYMCMFLIFLPMQFFAHGPFVDDYAAIKLAFAQVLLATRIYNYCVLNVRAFLYIVAQT